MRCSEEADSAARLGPELPLEHALERRPLPYNLLHLPAHRFIPATRPQRPRQRILSTLQRRLCLRYGPAARILDMMQHEGIIGPPDGSKPREVLKRPDWLEEVENQLR